MPLCRIVAALLIMSAAISAAAQSRAARPQQSGQATAPGKHNAREQTAPSPDGKNPDGSQNISPAPPGDAPDAVRYSYEFTQPNFFVSHILIEHNGAGRGKISFERQGGDAPIVEPFELSTAARERIMPLWDALRFLESDTNYQSTRQYPHLGTMRLGMKRGERERVAEFNWTNDTQASALVNEYKRAADQAILVFDINLARENQPLSVPNLIDYLDRLFQRNGLSDPRQLVSLLSDINTDERLPLIARNHAERLRKKIEK